MRGKEIFLIASSLIVASLCLADGFSFATFYANTNASASGSAATSRVQRAGLQLDAIVLDYTAVTNAYVVTNGATASNPNCQGGYFYNGSFGTSTQSYLEDGAVYDLWFTNGVWYINAARGTTTNGWTSLNATVTGTYVSDGAASTGSVQVVALYADFDIDIATTTDGGGVSRTIYSVDDTTTNDAVLYPVFQSHTPAGSSATNLVPMPFYGDKVRLDVYDSLTTGISVRVTGFTSKR